jgi:hypothetical protein
MTSPTILSPPCMHPPVSVVYVGPSKPAPKSASKTAVAPFKSAVCVPFSTSLTASGFGSSPASSSGNFRLQPRQLQVGTTSSPPSQPTETTPSRKRGVVSMSAACATKSASPAPYKTDPQLPPDLERLGLASVWSTPSKASTPERSMRSVNGAVFNLQGLSLQSPVRPSPFRPPSGRDMDITHHHQPPPLSLMSSFSVYSNSPGHSIQAFSSMEETDSTGYGETRRSPALGSTASSPRILPVKVLLHQGPRTPSSSRPPLHLSSTPSTSYHHPEEFETPRSLLPPPVLTASSPAGSLSTIHDPDDQLCDPPGKQRRTLLLQSPRSRRSTPGRSPRTPLPKVNLTPRSDRISCFSQFDGFPRFPSPTAAHVPDSNMPSMNPSQEILERAYNQEVVAGSATPSSSTKQESFIPLPDWDEPKTTSWLTPSRSSEQFSDMFPEEDSDSLSDDDSVSGFVLAPPSIIVEEKSSLGHASIKQRRPRPPSSDHFRRIGSMTSSKYNSNASLLGMDFVASSNCLNGLEGKPSSTPSLSGTVRGQPKPPFPEHGLRRDESLTSVGLNLDTDQAANSGRDLVTPPPIPTLQVNSPPPISPRSTPRNGFKTMRVPVSAMKSG